MTNHTCYDCYIWLVEIIAHRDLRNDSSAVLARVRAGQTIGVTNRGELAAVLIPPGARTLDLLRAAGAVRPARGRVDFASIRRALPPEGGSAGVLADVRGDW